METQEQQVPVHITQPPLVGKIVSTPADFVITHALVIQRMTYPAEAIAYGEFLLHDCDAKDAARAGLAALAGAKAELLALEGVRESLDNLVEAVAAAVEKRP